MEDAQAMELLRRQQDNGQLLLEYLKDSFAFSQKSLYASIGTSFGFSLLIFLAFCIIRPHNSVVYAPKLRQQDRKHPPPPPVGNGFLSWLTPLVKTREVDLVDRIGLDATIFLRSLRMLRTIFCVLTLGGLILIGVNVGVSLKIPAAQRINANNFVLMSPQLVTGNYGRYMYAHLVMSYVFDIVICYFLWRNYSKIVSLKKKFFQSSEYQDSLYSRTLMITDVPKPAQSDEGLAQIVARIQVDDHDRLALDERASIARDVMELPKLIEEHEKTVRKLEHVLAKYLKNPDKIPIHRPTMKPFKEDGHAKSGVKMDAIEYLDERMKGLEFRIGEIRRSAELKKPFPYGFVSYSNLTLAHSVAIKAKGKHPQGTNITLSPAPNDLLWNNLAKTKGERRRNNIIGWLYFVLLSLTWIVPNAFIATFVANISHIGALWPAFAGQVNKHPTFYALVQGFASPLIISLFFLLLPVVMRRISAWQGSFTKTNRETNTVAKLYSFFVFNNLIVFTIFGTLWNFISTVVQSTDKKASAKDIIMNYHIVDHLVGSVFGVSVFWITYLLQRNLGALLDLVQLVSLFWKWYSKRFLSPTPRNLIEWTAPQYMDVSAYYNYFLFYATIALVFAPVQPLILIAGGFYFTVESFLRKYSFMYVFQTKTESNGGYWHVLFDRMLFATGFANVITGCVIWVNYNGQAACGIIPLLLILIGFKFYCRQSFDDDLQFYIKNNDTEAALATKPGRNDKLARRFGHPALTKRLITPMVAEKAKHVLAKVYQMRNEESEPYSSAYGGDQYNMSDMQSSKVGQTNDNGIEQYAFIAEAEMDYAKLDDHRSEFGFSTITSPGPSRSGTPAPTIGGRRTPGPVESMGEHASGLPDHYNRSTSPLSYTEYNRPLSPGFNNRPPRVTPYLSRNAHGSQSDLAGLLAEQRGDRPVTPNFEQGQDLGRMRNVSGQDMSYGWQEQPTQPQIHHNRDNNNLTTAYQSPVYQSTPYTDYDHSGRASPYEDVRRGW